MARTCILNQFTPEAVLTRTIFGFVSIQWPDTSVPLTLSTMTNSRHNGVDATVNACTGFTYLCDVRAVLYMQLYFPTIRKDFHCNVHNSMCMQYFSADELTTGVKNTQQRPVLFRFAHIYFSSPEFGGWRNEQLRHPLYIHNNWNHVQSRAHHVHMCAFNSYNHCGRKMNSRKVTNFVCLIISFWTFHEYHENKLQIDCDM